MALDKRISLQKLEVFCLVVELGGVSRAAEHLYVAQPVVSAHMRSLQERLGARLTYRDGRRLRLTEAGETVYEWATEVLSRGAEVSREIEGLAEGTAGAVSLASSTTVGSYLLPGILSEFRRARPQARIALHIADAGEALREMEVGACDFAVVMVDGTIESPQFVVEHVTDVPLVLVAGAADDQVGEAIHVSRLETLRYVDSPRDQYRRRLVQNLLRRNGVHEREIAIELGHAEAMKRATLDGLGVALLFAVSVEAELASGALREVRVEGADLAVPIVLVRRAGKRLSLLQSDLTALISRRLRGDTSA